MSKITVLVQNGGTASTNGRYTAQNPAIIPAGFDHTCKEMNWDTAAMWQRLSDGKRPWFEAENGSYIYWNRGDGKWWIDGPSGAGVYIAFDDGETPPEDGWMALPGAKQPLPMVKIENES